MKGTRVCIMVVGALTSFGQPEAWAWTAVDCAAKKAEVDRLHQEFYGTSSEAQWDAYRQGVATATKGGPLYAPAPFPKSREEVLRNVKYAYFEVLFDDAGELPDEELAIYKGMLNDTFSFRIIRVENWGISRCTSSRPIPYYDLVRVYDERGEEVARFAMHHTGILDIYSHTTPAAREQSPDVHRVLKSVTEALAVELAVQDVKWVTTDGLPQHCASTVPCAALRSGDTTYIWDLGQAIYAIDQSSPRQSVTERKRQVIRAGSLVALGADPAAETVWLSTGFEWVKAHRARAAP